MRQSLVQQQQVKDVLHQFAAPEQFDHRYTQAFLIDFGHAPGHAAWRHAAHIGMVGDIRDEADMPAGEAPALRSVDVTNNLPSAESPGSLALGTAPQTPAQPSPNTAPIAPQTPATVQPPQDFSALIDRLVEARQAAQANLTPGTVHAAVAHTDFGQVSLQFQQDGGGLTVAMASGDPEFARAVQAAAPAGQTSTGSDNGTPNRQDAPGQQPRARSSAASHPPVTLASREPRPTPASTIAAMNHPPAAASSPEFLRNPDRKADHE